MISQWSYSVLYWVTLGCSLFASFTGREVVGAIMFAISGMYLVAGDISKRLDKISERP